MSYADVVDVQGRAGALLDVLTANPTTVELTTFLSDVSGLIDGFMVGWGYPSPTVNTAALAALRSTTIDGALVLGLEARFKAGDPPQALIGARARWMAALREFALGRHPAQLILSQSGVGVLAGSFGADDADGYLPAPLDPNRTTPVNTNTEAVIYEGMHL